MSIWRKKLLWHPLLSRPNSGPLSLWRTQASSWTPSVVVYYLITPSDCLHTANSSLALWAWPPKPKPQDTSSTCPSGWNDIPRPQELVTPKSVQVSWLCPLHLCCWALLWGSILPSLFPADLVSEGSPAETFSSFTAPPRGTGLVLIPFFISSFLLPLPCYVEISCSFETTLYCSVMSQSWSTCRCTFDESVGGERRILFPSHIFLLGYLPWKCLSEGVHYPKILILYHTWEVFSFQSCCLCDSFSFFNFGVLQMGCFTLNGFSFILEDLYTSARKIRFHYFLNLLFVIQCVNDTVCKWITN